MATDLQRYHAQRLHALWKEFCAAVEAGGRMHLRVSVYSRDGKRWEPCACYIHVDHHEILLPDGSTAGGS